MNHVYIFGISLILILLSLFLYHFYNYKNKKNIVNNWTKSQKEDLLNYLNKHFSDRTGFVYDYTTYECISNQITANYTYDFFKSSNYDWMKLGNYENLKEDELPTENQIKLESVIIKYLIGCTNEHNKLKWYKNTNKENKQLLNNIINDNNKTVCFFSNITKSYNYPIFRVYTSCIIAYIYFNKKLPDILNDFLYNIKNIIVDCKINTDKDKIINILFNYINKKPLMI